MPATRPPAVRIGLAVALVLIVILASRTLPLDAMLATLRAWVSAHGAVGMVGFGAAYVGLVLLLVPGAALTLIAGALFGPRWGVVIVAIATSVADAVAFLLARYVAGAAVQRLRRRHPRFSALDQALVDGGWRIVALLRLNPAISVQREQLPLWGERRYVSAVSPRQRALHAAGRVRVCLSRLCRRGNSRRPRAQRRRVDRARPGARGHGGDRGLRHGAGQACLGDPSIMRTEQPERCLHGFHAPLPPPWLSRSAAWASQPWSSGSEASS